MKSVLSRMGRAPAAAEPRRNDLCLCGSGLKYKRCCGGPAATRAVAGPPAAASDSGERARISALRDAGRFVEATRLARTAAARNPADPAAQTELGLVHLHAGKAADAVAVFQGVVRLAPTVGRHRYNLACALETVSRNAEAAEAYQQAVELDATLTDAWERLGNLLQSRGLPSRAARCLRQVWRAEPGTLRGQLSHAKAFREEGNIAEAEARFRDIVIRYPANNQALRQLAAILRERGAFGEAIPLLEQATEGTPSEAALAYFNLVLSKHLTAVDEPIIEQMRVLLRYSAMPDLYIAQLHFALGKALDDLRDPEAAMRHFDEGNRMVRRTMPFDRAQHAANIQRLIAGSPPEFFQANRGAGNLSDLPVLIVGMPRSGTSLVEQIVSSHRDAGGGGELPFWYTRAEAVAREGLTEAACGRIAAEYLTELRRIAPDMKRVTDKQPLNYLWAGLIHTVFPKARIIHCRRHPADTCLSAYFTYFGADLPFAYDKADLAFYVRQYERLMAHWRSVLPRETFMDVDYEALVADPEGVSREMIDFLGLEWDEACLRPQDNPRIVRTASMWQVRQPTNRGSTERWRRYEPWLGPLRTLLEPNDPAVAAQPVSNNPRLAAARALSGAGRYDDALNALREALRLTPEDPVVYHESGAVLLRSGNLPSAVACFETAIGLCPHFATAYYNLGTVLERLGQPNEALAALRQAIVHAPHMAEAHSRIGNLLNARGDPAAADYFRRSAALTTNPADRALDEAKLQWLDGQTEAAEAALRRSLALNGGNALAYAMLGDLLGEAGRFDEATKCLEHAVALEPDRVGSWHSLSILRKFNESDRPLINRLNALLARPGRTDFDRIMLHFALGKAHDDLREYDKAIRHFDQGNRLEHGRQRFDRAALTAEIDRRIDTFTPAWFARRADPACATPACDSALPVIVLGMPRSGTTLVERIVSSHPRVGGGEELTFWTVQADQQAPMRQMADGYIALLRGIAPGADRVTDRNPFNFLHIGLIHRALPNARIIHTRRHPVDTCLSIFFTRFAAAQPFAYDRGDLVFYYREYQRLMAHWDTVLPPDRLLTVDYEDLTADPDAVIRPIIAFCGLDWDDACLTPEHNRRQVRTASIWQARQPIHSGSVARWRNYDRWLGELRTLLRPGEE